MPAPKPVSVGHVVCCHHVLVVDIVAYHSFLQHAASCRESVIPTSRYSRSGGSFLRCVINFGVSNLVTNKFYIALLPLSVLYRDGYASVKCLNVHAPNDGYAFPRQGTYLRM